MSRFEDISSSKKYDCNETRMRLKEKLVRSRLAAFLAFRPEALTGYPKQSEASKSHRFYEDSPPRPQNDHGAASAEKHVALSRRISRVSSREVFSLSLLLAVGIAVRLLKISQPYVDSWSFKQGTIAMIAENFYRNGFNIFYPQINWAGNSPGYIGTEFPLVPFLASLLYVPFGVHEWIGRAVSVMFFALSVPFFYLLVKKIFNQQSATWAAVIYMLAPLGVFASRSFMSDMASLSFSIMALYFFRQWLERSNSLSLLLAAGLATGSAILIKAPAVIIGVPLLYMAWQEQGAGCFRQPKVWLFAALSLIFPAAWYLHAYLITLSYAPHKFAGSEGMALADLPLYALIVRRLVGSSLTPLVTAAMVLGFCLPTPRKHGRAFHWWLAAVGLFALLAGLGNRHPWYQLPAVPIAAALSGRAFHFALRRLGTFAGSKITRPVAAIMLLIALGFFSYKAVKPLYDPWAIPLRKAGHRIDRIAPPEALAIFVADGDSSEIYYSKRKGWHAFDDSDWGAPLDSAQAISNLEALRHRGARYLAFTRYTVWWLDYYKDFAKHLDSHYLRTQDTKDYIIFDLALDPNGGTVNSTSSSSGSAPVVRHTPLF